MAETLRPIERIRRKRDFETLYQRGRRYRGKYLILIAHPNELKCSRMSAVVSRKNGNAVRRNRIKRQIRTLFRQNKELLIIPMDILFIPRRTFQTASWSQLEKEYRKEIQLMIGTKS